MGEIDKPGGFHALDDRGKAAHRGKIALRVESILNQFWREDTSDAHRAMEVEGWVATLETCSHDEVLSAWVSYQRNGPRTERGVLIRPDAGAIYHLALKNRPAPPIRVVGTKPEPVRPPISPQRAKEIIAEVYGSDRAEQGFVMPAPKKFGGSADA